MAASSPADGVRPVAEQGRAAQVQDRGKGDVGAQGHGICPDCRATRPVPTGAASGPGPRRPTAAGAGRPRPSAAPTVRDSSATSRRPDQENEDAQVPGASRKNSPAPMIEDAAADGEDFLVQPARPGLLPARRSAPGSAGPAGRRRTDASGVCRGCRTYRSSAPGSISDRHAPPGDDTGATPSLLADSARFVQVSGEPTSVGSPLHASPNSPSPRP